MVLAASSNDGSSVELLVPPEGCYYTLKILVVFCFCRFLLQPFRVFLGAVVGERIGFGGEPLKGDIAQLSKNAGEKATLLDHYLFFLSTVLA
jgi:hypothetical protein